MANLKANELQIGNFIQWEDDSKEIVQVKSIDPGEEETKDMYFVNGGWIEDFIPVPLTEEWLTKFGFEEKEGDYFIAYNFPLIAGNFKIETERWFVMMDRIIVARCKYVHQLQNLFFALSGEELTVK